MLTIEKAREIFGEPPKEVEKDSYYRNEFLMMYGLTVDRDGEKKVKEQRVMHLEAWKLIRTYL